LRCILGVAVNIEGLSEAKNNIQSAGLREAQCLQTAASPSNGSDRSQASDDSNSVHDFISPACNLCDLLGFFVIMMAQIMMCDTVSATMTMTMSTSQSIRTVK
jgi:hypothetical protein